MKQTSKYTFALYWQHIAHHKKAFFISIISIPLGLLIIDTALPYLFSQAIGQLAEKNTADVYQTLLMAVGAGAVGVTLNLIGFQTLTRLEARVGARIRGNTFERLMRKDMQFFVDQKIGAMTGKYVDFFRSYVVLQDLLIIRTLGFALSIIVGLSILAFQSLTLAGMLLALLLILIVEVKWSLKVREPWREERKKYRTELFGKVADSLSNAATVKAFGNESHEIKSVNHTNTLFRNAFIKDIGFLSAEGSMRIALLVIVQLIAISACAYLVQQESITIATAIFSISYLQLIGSRLFSIGELLNGYEQALLDASPMSEMLMTEDTVVDAPDAKSLTNFTPSIEISHASYQYSDATTPALSEITLTIPAGQKVGLVGHSGSGKTTLSKLLLRFSDVTEGAITIDAHDLRAITQESLHRAIAYVPQESVLFHRSLRENIAYANPSASDEQIIAAAKKAHAWEFIKQLPEKLDTVVGERGIKLSGGQRQRIAIARAILKDAPILLLDEATSALDSESEALIQKSLSTLMKNRTSIVIAHRLSTIAQLDRIIVLDHGKIAEDGTHASLLTQNGIYAGLWKHQSGGFIEE